MKKTYLAVAMLSSLLFGACSSDGDSNSNGSGNDALYTETELSEAPVWQIDWNYDQERPDWSKPDATLYENWTTMMAQIQDELQPYVSEGDMMALFVDDELRGLATPAVTIGDNQQNSTTFLMKVYGNETGSETVNASLRYYSQKLRHIFTLSQRITLNSDETTGTEEDYIPPFTLGSAKYPIVKTVNVEPLLTKVGIIPTQENIAGAFVDEECRGTVTLSASGSTQMIIYGRQAGESVTLKYYDADKGVLYSVSNAVTM